MFKIENPLTLMSVFCGVAEAAIIYGVGVTQSGAQIVLTIFASAFPFFVAGAFFYILYFKHAVLYSPKDFRDEASFLSLVSELKQDVYQRIASGSAPPEEREKLIHDIGNAFERATRSHLQSKILFLLSENSEMSTGDIARSLAVSAPAAKINMDKLLEKGDVKKTMMSKRVIWSLNKS